MGTFIGRKVLASLAVAGNVTVKVAKTVAKKKKPQAKRVAKPKKRKPAATPRGESAGTRDYVPAKDRRAPLQRALTGKEEKELVKLVKTGEKARKKSNAAARARMRALKVKTTLKHPGAQSGAATAATAAEGKRRADNREAKKKKKIKKK